LLTNDILVAMSKAGKFNPDDVVKAFRDAATQSGCQNSEQRFQEMLFVIGREKPLKARGKRRSLGNLKVPRADRRS
jgi:hypothetical protein